MKKSHITRVFPWLLVIVWMGVIFYLSHQPANQSSHLSSGISDTIIQIIQRLAPFIPLDESIFHHLLRKSAHFTAYFVLGGLVMHALHLPYRKGAVLALVISAVYATSDEVHQLFIPGRSGEVSDVFIDSVGATTGIGVYVLSMFIFRHFRKKGRKKHVGTY